MFFMCVLCEREALARLGVGVPIGVELSLIGGNQLPANILIDERNARYSKQLVSRDQLMSVYLHSEGGAVQIGGGGSLQTIKSIEIPAEDQIYINSLIASLEKFIDIDFSFISTPETADIAIYYNEIVSYDSSTILGLASAGVSGWELFVNYPEIANDFNYRKYVIAHELGHSLGLEHPFEDRDGDVYKGVLDPWASAYPEDTVMAYRAPLNGSWPSFFSEADLRALVEIWGQASSENDEELESLINYNDIVKLGNGDDWLEVGLGDDFVNGGEGDDQLYGNQGIDTLLGALGSDKIYGGKDSDWLFGNQQNDLLIGNIGNDRLYGGKDDDNLYGNQGVDRLYGNLGNDRLYGGKDADNLYGNQGIDRLYGNLGNDSLWAGQDDDWLDGGAGNDVLWGNKGADRFRLSEGNDVIYDFSVTEGDLLEVERSLSLTYEQLGHNLQISHPQGTFLLLNTTYGSTFSPSSEILWV